MLTHFFSHHPLIDLEFLLSVDNEMEKNFKCNLHPLVVYVMKQFVLLLSHCNEVHNN